jgi:hypothetical protein
MRQLGCMSADIYCQITNNDFYATPSLLYSNRKKGKRARECARDREWPKMELASVVKMAVGRGINYLEISRNSNISITFS